MSVFEFYPRKKGRTYSKGNRQKVALISALVTPADLYILDEPTSGLDPLMEVVFNREVARVAGEGATVLLSSHILSEVEQLCDRVSIIRAGKTVETGTLASLRHLTRIEISFAAAGLSAEQLASIPASDDLTVSSGRAQFTAEDAQLVDVLPALARLGARGLVVAPPSLEELFMRHYGDRVEPAPAGDANGAEGSRHAKAGAR